MERRLRLKLPHGQFLNVAPSRSRTMSAIRSKNTRTTERRLRMVLIRARIAGWQLHPDELPGRPDIYFPKQRLAIFIDGCFWHGCSRCGHIPKTRRSFWAAKILRNRARDRATARKLKERKMNVIRIWEHSLHDRARTNQVVRKIRKLLDRQRQH
jgi:DNA mismatch endonuclease Vsr